MMILMFDELLIFSPKKSSKLMFFRKGTGETAGIKDNY
jgi:hypothetical protein